ncbi:glycerol-3-phosphate dehydrogenase/oxidase [Microbacterium sp. STN6]|uniref:glycerol-3-phosphate dehydrogenase/oxidase n=1 Tax=Microbacterium sp. STN6 TaxID=2995588 RepID=UPI002260A905|nr:glycerol-3-phosphate dehydrogenase/oxidase [Microbacterium sp. STN6]MCX7520956.1 glycerol-3-phosphate dehydrogenase/oxidase [Microbacterium sp. STN6]
MTRQKDSGQAREVVAAIRNAPHAQVVVIGGGINGIGTFRDLALQGVEVVLVERGDFASGASSASSHMIHGGIRYLENGEFRLVRESVHERNGLLKIAPHYVKPLRTTIPIFSTFSGIMAAPLRFLTHRQGKIVERGAFLIKLGLTMYDAFSRDGGTVPRHVFRGAAASKRELPRLNPDTKYTATYFDASVHEPERLALDVLMDGLASGPHARAANYLEAVGVADGGVRVRDTLSGDEFTITADVVVNASGPWTDLTNEALGGETRYMGGTKGSHIVLDNPELLEACAGRELFFENSDGRIVLIYPLRGRVMVGTTDLEADIRQPARCTEEEVDYFFDLVSHVFPDVAIDRSQIVFRFSGVRPLPRHDDTQPGFVSRDYRIVPTTPAGLNGATVLSLVGGKWTTFRAVAEHLAGDVLALLGRERRVSTNGLAIGGGRGYPTTDSARRDWIAANGAGVGRGRAEQLLARYGTRAKQVIAFLEEHGDRALTHTDELTSGELVFIAENELVVHVADVLLRRTSMAFDGRVDAAVIDEIARELGSILGWSDARVRDEVAAARAVMTEEHGVRLGLPAEASATASE